MKLEQKEKSLIFSETPISDIFFSEYLSQIPGDYLKVYMYFVFLSKYKKEINLNDLSKKINLPLKTINDATAFLEEHELLLKKENGFIVVNLQEATLNKLYSPNLTLSPEKIEENSKNKSRSEAIKLINNQFFQGIMGPSWYNDIDLWFSKYNFDDQVMFALFNYCFNRSALHKNYVQKVAETWGNNNVHTWNDLDAYDQKQEKLLNLKKTISKKLGKKSNLTQYEEAYVERWLYDYNYDLNIIELALKRTTFKTNPTFEYINNILTDWHDRKFTNTNQIEAFLEQRKQQQRNIKEMKKQVNKSSFEQRQYDNLDFLYANNTTNT